MDPRPAPGAAPVRLWVAAALPAVLALAWFWPALRFGFLNDDFLLGYYLVQDAPDVQVQWSRLLSQFTGPFFGVPFLYRPLVATTMVANALLGGGEPFGYHLYNLLLVASAAAGLGLLAALHAPRARLPAALAGAALLLLHPATVEPACWISGRTATQAVCFSILCLAAFAARLRRGRPRPWLEVGLALLALGSREEAVVLPLSLLALDWLHEARRPLRDRLRLHLPVLLAVSGYLLVRWLALGGLAPGRPPLSLPVMAGHLLARGQALFWPAGGFLPVLAPALLLAGLVAALRQRPAVLLLGIGWLALVYAPGLGIAARDPVTGGRFVWCGLPVLAVLVAAGCQLARPRWLAGALPLLALAAALTWAGRARELLSHYRRATEEIARMQQDLLAFGAEATPARPLTITSLRTGNPLPLLHPKAWFPLVERPFAPRDVPVAGLGFVLEPDPNAGDLHRDPSAIYAMAELGSPVLSWDRWRGGVRALSWPPRQRRELAAAENGAPVFAAEDLDPLSFERVIVRAVAPPAAGEVALHWWTEPPLPPEFGALPVAAARSVEGGAMEYAFDATASLSALLIGELGLRWRGLRIRGLPVESVQSVVLHPRLLPLALPRILAGAELSLQEAATALRAPAAEVPAMRLLVIGPSTGQAMPVLPGQPVRLSEGILAELRYARDVARQQRFYYFFQAGAYRSPVDWFTLHDDSR